MLICLGLGVITLALYLPALRHEFVAYDDQQYVTENARVQAGLAARNLAWAFGFHAGNWHPLTWFSHMLDCQLYGLRPWGHHLTNALLHAASTMLLFLVLKRLTRATWRSAGVAALFGWHPLHVESVAWVAERKDVLCAFFWMLTLLAYSRYAAESKAQSSKPKVWYFATLGLFALALMSKPMAVTLPFVLLLLDYWPLDRFSKIENRKSKIGSVLLEKVPFLALTAIACGLTISAQEQAIVSTAGLPMLHRLAHALLAYQHYLDAMIVPRNLAVFYPYETTLSTVAVGLAGGLLALITVLVLWQVKRRPYWALGWFWFLGTLVPVIGLVQVGEQAWADRYTYLPLIGPFVALVWGAFDLAGRARLQARDSKSPTASARAGRTGAEWLLGVVGVAVCVALLVATSLQLRHWKNTRTLFERAAAVTRNNHLAVTMLGSILAGEGRLEEAKDQYRLALRHRPGYAEAHFFLGRALDQQGKLDEAIAEYNRALRFKPLQEQTHLFLGVALARQQKLDQAAAHYLQALKLNPESAVAHNNFARLLHLQGRLDEAIEHYFAALKFDPGLAQAHNNLGILLVQKGRLAEGAGQLREAARLNPGNPETEYNLALALNQQGEWREAAELFARTVGPDSPDPNAHYQFARALGHLHQTREALGQYAQALLLQPDFADALDGLSWILATDANPGFRNGTEAVRMAERACELTGRKDAAKLKTLAAAYAEAGRFPEAISTVAQAHQLADRAGQPEVARQCQLLQERFNAASPWREERKGR